MFGLENKTNQTELPKVHNILRHVVIELLYFYEVVLDFLKENCHVIKELTRKEKKC